MLKVTRPLRKKTGRGMTRTHDVESHVSHLHHNISGPSPITWLQAGLSRMGYSMKVTSARGILVPRATCYTVRSLAQTPVNERGGHKRVPHEAARSVRQQWSGTHKSSTRGRHNPTAVYHNFYVRHMNKSPSWALSHLRVGELLQKLGAEASLHRGLHLARRGHVVLRKSYIRETPVQRREGKRKTLCTLIRPVLQRCAHCTCDIAGTR